MLYGISAVFIQMPFSGDAVLDALDLDALDLDALDVGIRPPARTPDTPSSTR
jgi:hypothetical protein